MHSFDRRKFIQYISATGGITLLPSCLKSYQYEGEQWWTKGGYAPIQEELDQTTFVVEGEIPTHLNGMYVRNGGNFRGSKAPHYFVGDGMLHGIWLEEGKAKLYRNRWVQTTLIKDNKEPSANKEDNMSNTSIISYGGRLLSLMEIGFPYEINSDLSTKGVYRFQNTLETAMTAHPKINPRTKNLQFYGMSFMSNPYLHYREASESGEIVLQKDFTLPGSSMQHDFQRTENYVLFLDLPIVFSTWKAIQGDFPYEWLGDKYNARIGVWSRKNPESEIRWFEIQTCFCFHTCNAFEEADGTIKLQLSRFRQLWMRSPYDINEPSQLYEYHIHPQKGILSERALDDLRIDFGFVDFRIAGTKHRTSYFSSLSPTGPEITDPVRFSGVVSYDTKGVCTGTYEYPEEMDCGEFSFVPLSEDAPEGVGHLMGFVYNKREDKSTLDIFNAEELAQGPIARIHIQNRVPFGFHGTFVPNT